MIHNHEVPGSIPGLATEAEKVEKLSPLFVFIIFEFIFVHPAAKNKFKKILLWPILLLYKKMYQYDQILGYIDTFLFCYILKNQCASSQLFPQP